MSIKTLKKLAIVRDTDGEKFVVKVNIYLDQGWQILSLSAPDKDDPEYLAWLGIHMSLVTYYLKKIFPFL